MILEKAKQWRHLTELCRRRIGNYNLNNAININTVKNIELINQ